MKTKEDFIVMDGIARLIGVSYAEEAKVVLDYLKTNPHIKNVMVISKDNRSFELVNEVLVSTNKEMFDNPFYVGHQIYDKVSSNSVENNISVENRIKIIEEKISKYEEILNRITHIFSDF